MDDENDRTHRIVVCTDCRHFGGPCKPGLELVARLQAAVRDAGPLLADDFSIEGTVCTAACERPCTVGFQASGKAAYLFGDIGECDDIAALVSFAQFYRDRPNGMSRAGEPPKALNGKTPARVPAAIVASEQLACSTH